MNLVDALLSRSFAAQYNSPVRIPGILVTQSEDIQPNYTEVVKTTQSRDSRTIIVVIERYYRNQQNPGDADMFSAAFNPVEFSLMGRRITRTTAINSPRPLGRGVPSWDAHPTPDYLRWVICMM